MKTPIKKRPIRRNNEQRPRAMQIKRQSIIQNKETHRFGLLCHLIFVPLGYFIRVIEHQISTPHQGEHKRNRCLRNRLWKLISAHTSHPPNASRWPLKKLLTTFLPRSPDFLKALFSTSTPQVSQLWLHHADGGDLQESKVMTHDIAENGSASTEPSNCHEHCTHDQMITQCYVRCWRLNGS